LLHPAKVFHKACPASFISVQLGNKQTRRRLTGAIKAYIERHPELSENNRKWLYVNASQRAALVVFGRKAKKLAEDLGVAPDNLLDALTPNELILLLEVEHTAMLLLIFRICTLMMRFKVLLN